MNWNFDAPIIIQGIAEPQAIKCYQQMLACETEVVGGISSGYSVDAVINLAIFNLVTDAVKAVGQLETSIILVPPYQVLDASLEAIASEIKQLIIVTPNVPPLDTIKLLNKAQTNKVALLGPGSAGIVIPEKLCFGTLQPEYFCSGNVGIIGYGEALVYEVAWTLNQANIGQSLAISLGQDKIIGSSLPQWLQILDEDDSTAAIILIQSVKDIDRKTLDLLADYTSKPVVCYVANVQTPADQVLREGLTIVKNYLSNVASVANSDKKNLNSIKKSGAIVATQLLEIPELIKQAIQKRSKK